MNNTGILITNIGTPSAPTTQAVKHYLKKFLSDPRVIEFPKILWLPILHGYILRTRPQQSARLYQKIWTKQGSPLLYYSKQIAHKLQARLNLPVELGMHYSEPSIHTALQNLRKKNIKKLTILPLYPQYSATTTASTLDFVFKELKTWRHLPEIQTIHSYCQEKNYIDLIADSIKKNYDAAKHLLFSFHSIPQKYADKGDPYSDLCHQTALTISNTLGLEKNQWSISFQSRLGRTPWISPYTDQILQHFPKQGVKDIQIVCPGFAVDCLETLEEINIRGREQFLKAGGNSFHYIPALNDTDEHITMLANFYNKTNVAETM